VLPQALLAWAAGGGVVAAIAGALQQMASQVHLGNSAGGLIAVTPATGVDFGTNQVVVLQEQQQQQQQQHTQPQQRQGKKSKKQQQQQRPGSSGSGSSSERTPGVPVVRELRITNVHASRSVLLLNVCVVSADFLGFYALPQPQWCMLLSNAREQCSRQCACMRWTVACQPSR
jgi:hypothetical protein